jgi:hypothetical protein
MASREDMQTGVGWIEIQPTYFIINKLVINFKRE